MMNSLLDQASAIRQGEELDVNLLKKYLEKELSGFQGNLEVQQFQKGHSNLTYLLKWDQKEYVLRRPPFGANIKTAHDMGREFNVLSLLKPHYDKVPQTLLHCEDDAIIGAPFYIMERVEGVILRSRIPKGMDANPAFMRQLSTALIENLADLHAIDIHASGLIDIGKPVGYVERQVKGWVQRYYKAETDKIEGMDMLADWLQANMPTEMPAALIHNDYKYDNVVLNPNHLSEISAVLDWEMATVGDPLMDLGTTLAYWMAADESEVLKPFNLSWLPGNLTRTEVIDCYLAKRNLELKADKILFYYIFGVFKLGVIAQQIYARFKFGHTQDKRFAAMIYLVKAGAKKGVKALEKGTI